MIEVACTTCRTPLSPDAAFCPRCGPDSLSHMLGERNGTLPPASSDTERRLTAALGDQFAVVRLFGRGGFAEVYEVRDTELERRLAVKVLRADMAWTRGMLARFKQEARAVAQLTHPNTVPIHFVGEGEGLVFYVMPYIEGASLADVLRAQGPLDAERAVSVALPILEALDHAHANGIVHRDIKPDNILIEAGSGRPLLLDFGIAKHVNGEGHPDAHDGMIVGTPLYMSPEQALGHSDVDARTDIYAMGALLFQMVTGAPPFDGNTSHEIVAKHLTEPVRIPPACAARLPAWLVEVIQRAMAKQPADRYQSAAEMLEPLRQGARRNRSATVITSETVAARINRDDPTLQMDAGDAVALVPGGRRGRRRRVGLLAAGVAIAGFGVGAAMLGSPPPALVLENALADSVAVSVNGEPSRTVRPGDSLRVTLLPGRALSARWKVIGPRDRDGAEIGDEIGGWFAEAEPRGDVRRRLDPVSAGAAYVVAAVDNATADTLAVTFRDSSGTLIPCNCAVPPGAVRAPLGYLRSERVRSVTLATRDGRSVTFDSLGARADSATRILVLGVGPADFAPRVLAAVRRGPKPAEPAFLPDLQLSVPPPSPVADSAPAPDTTRADSSVPPRRRTDPLAPIFQNGR